MSISSASQSHCTSGCESDWTYYLNESSFSDEKWERFSGGEDSFRAKRGGSRKVMEEEEDDDGGCNDEDNLSMVSDASSGPPYYDADEYWSSVNESCCHSSLGGNFSDQTGKEMKNTACGVAGREQHLHCHDTGSSCSSSMKNSIQPVLASSTGNSRAQSKDISQFKKNPDNVHSFTSVWRKKPSTGKSGARKWA